MTTKLIKEICKKIRKNVLSPVKIQKIHNSKSNFYKNESSILKSEIKLNSDLNKNKNINQMKMIKIKRVLPRINKINKINDNNLNTQIQSVFYSPIKKINIKKIKEYEFSERSNLTVKNDKNYFSQRDYSDSSEIFNIQNQTVKKSKKSTNLDFNKKPSILPSLIYAGISNAKKKYLKLHEKKILAQNDSSSDNFYKKVPCLKKRIERNNFKIDFKNNILYENCYISNLYNSFYKCINYNADSFDNYIKEENIKACLAFSKPHHSDLFECLKKN